MVIVIIIITNCSLYCVCFLFVCLLLFLFVTFFSPLQGVYVLQDNKFRFLVQMSNGKQYMEASPKVFKCREVAWVGAFLNEPSKLQHDNENGGSYLNRLICNCSQIESSCKRLEEHSGCLEAFPVVKYSSVFSNSKAFLQAYMSHLLAIGWCFLVKFCRWPQQFVH